MDRAKGAVYSGKTPCAMIRCRAAAAGIETKIGNHTFRATGITGYLKNGGALEKAAAMAKASASPFEFEVGPRGPRSRLSAAQPFEQLAPRLRGPAFEAYRIRLAYLFAGLCIPP
jgi:hypothetical protein